MKLGHRVLECEREKAYKVRFVSLTLSEDISLFLDVCVVII